MSIPLWFKVDKLPIRLWDESRNAVNAIEMFSSREYLIRTYNNSPETWNLKPPMLTWMQVGSMHLLGVNELAIRLPSVIASIIALVFVYLLTFKITKNKWFGFLSSVILVTSSGFYGDHVGRFGDHDALLVMFSIALVYYTYLFYQTNQSKYLYYMGAAICLGILTKSIAIVLFVPGISLFLLVNKRFISLLKNLHFYSAIAISLFPLLLYYGLRTLQQTDYLNLVWNDELFPRFLNQSNNYVYSDPGFGYYIKLLLNEHMSYWPWFLIAIVIAPILSKNIYKSWLLLAVTASTFLLIISKGTKNFWYDAPLIPLFAILISISLWTIFKRLKSPSWLTVLAIIIISTYPYSQAYSSSLNIPEPLHYEWETNGISYFLKDESHAKKLTSNTTILLDNKYGYEPHLFYVRKLELEKNIVLKRTELYTIQPNDTLLISHQSTFETLKNLYSVEVLDSLNSCTKLVVISRKDYFLR